MSRKVIKNKNKDLRLPAGCGNYKYFLESNNKELLCLAAETGNRAVRRKAQKKLRKMSIQGGN